MEGGSSRRELLDIIEQQKEKLNRYETRLKEVVKSYKSLAKEKTLLENSLKAVTDAAQEAEEVSSQIEAGSRDEGESPPKGTEESSFKSKISSLSANLANLTQEKADIEAKFLSERKKFKKEKEELSQELAKIKTNEQSLRSNLEEVKSKLIIEKHDREQETNNNRLMMKELQKLLADERALKEKLQEEIFALKSGDTTSNSPSEKEQSNQGARIEEMKIELETLKTKLQFTEKQLEVQNNTKEQLQKLQQELSAVRKMHHEQLETAEEAREAAELRAVEIQKQQEQRVVNLEAKLQELSESLAEYQRLRESDQSDIDRMRSRINLLSDENSVLVSSSATNDVQPKSSDSESKQEEQTVESLLAKAEECKAALIKKDVKSVLLEPVFSLPVHIEQLKTIQDLQRKIKNLEQSNKDRQGSVSSMYGDFLSNSEQTAQIEHLKSKTEVLHNKLSDAKGQVTELKKDLEQRRQDMAKLKETHDRENEVVRLENKKKIGVLRIELEEQRSRSINLMEEKDAEIQRLQLELEKSVEEVFYSPDRKKSTSPASVPSRKVSCDIGEMSAGGNTSGAPLHYIQELSRKEVEVKELRANILQLESTLRELQLNMSTKEEKYQDTIDDLENTVARLERMSTSEGANLEYLKNVVLTYMLSTDVSSKNHMLKAIGAVLKLSKSEIKRVMEQNAYSSWWSQQQSSTSGNKFKS